ncbi:MAG: hypothetical protein ACLP9K_02475 [Nitrososphaerales archaeon]
MSGQLKAHPEKKFKFEITTSFGLTYYTDEVSFNEGMATFEPKAVRSPTLSDCWDPKGIDLLIPLYQIVKVTHLKLNPQKNP